MELTAEFNAPVEIGHAMGYNGKHSDCIAIHPTDNSAEVFVYPIGKLLVMGDMNDPHKQVVLHGHDTDITSLDVSGTGRFVCSAQGRSLTADGYGPICVWDYATTDLIYKLKGHKGGTLCAKFSADDKWIASTGVDGQLLIWDMEMGSVSGAVKEAMNLNSPPFVKWAAWGAMDNANARRPKYSLCVGYEKECRVTTWEFNIKTMAFGLTQTLCAVPDRKGGLGRYYNNGSISPCGEYVMTGTTSGDVVIFNMDSGSYRGHFAASTNITSILCVPGDAVLVGGVDGTLKKFEGKGWTNVAEIPLVGAVTSLTCTTDGLEVIAGTSAGVVYRVLVSDLMYTILMQSHISAVRRLTFPNRRSDIFASCADDGSVRQWDLSDYSLKSYFIMSSNPHRNNPISNPCSICYNFDDATLLTGWSDGFVRVMDMSQAAANVVWQIPNSHKGAVTTIVATDQYFCTAGDDCQVRVWSQQSREQLISVSEHKRCISGVLVDNTTPAIIHTIGWDKNCYTYDLFRSDIAKQAKRLTYHSDKDGLGLTSIVQRTDNEHELIVSTGDGKLLTYDIDYFEPTMVVADPSRIRINFIAISPSGTHLACGSADGALTLYDIRYQPFENLGHSKLHSGEILCVAWSPDEKQILTSGTDHALCVWNFYGADGLRDTF